MFYNDYPIPTEKLINVLSKEYENRNKVTASSVGRVGILEQKSKLNELYVYISAQKKYLTHIQKLSKNFSPCVNVDNHLKLLNTMGVECMSVFNSNPKSCMADYFKCEAEILKLLTFLILLDNLNYNRAFLSQIMNEQLQVFSQIVNM